MKLWGASPSASPEEQEAVGLESQPWEEEGWVSSGTSHGRQGSPANRPGGAWQGLLRNP